MSEDDIIPKKKKKDNNNDSGEFEHSEEASSDSPRAEQPVYLDEIILENVEKTISQTKNAKLPSVEEMKKMVGAYETIKNIGKERNEESDNKNPDCS